MNRSKVKISTRETRHYTSAKQGTTLQPNKETLLKINANAFADCNMSDITGGSYATPDLNVTILS